MTSKDQRSYDPFHEFINFNLDMDGVDGVSFETVALAMRDVIRNLPVEQNGDMWDGQLDRLQATLRMCLSIETIGRMVHDNPRFTSIDSRDLDLIVNLSITLAYICYNQLAQRFGFESESTTTARQDTTKLWVALRAASGWVDKAAADGDTVAKGMSDEIVSLLEAIKPAGWTNNTRTLPE